MRRAITQRDLVHRCSLNEEGIAFVVIEHDIDFVARIADELDGAAVEDEDTVASYLAV